MTQLELKAAELLKLSLAADERKATKQLQSRIAGIGLASYCHRCDGTGQYSFNGTHSVCYHCGGGRYEATKVTVVLIGQIEEFVAAGKLEPYLEDIRRKGAAKRAAESAVSTFLAAWKAAVPSESYSWSAAAEAARNGVVTLDREISDTVNQPLYAALKNLQQATDELRSLAHRPIAKGEAAERQTQIEAKHFEIAKLLEDGLALCEEKRVLREQIQARYAGNL